jgi:plasmid stabilization system protein ParE
MGRSRSSGFGKASQMRLPVELTPEAEADLDEAARWYEQRSPGLGVSLVAHVRETFASIGMNYEIC